MPLAPDRPDLLPWSRGNPITADRLNRLQAAMLTDITGGPGILVARKGNSVSISAKDQPQRTPAAVAVVIVTGHETGGGKYSGYLWTPPTIGAPAAGNLSAAELGTISTSIVRIINVREETKSTHDIDVSGTFYPSKFLGLYRGTAADGVPVYAIDGRQSEDCT